VNLLSLRQRAVSSTPQIIRAIEGHFSASTKPALHALGAGARDSMAVLMMLIVHTPGESSKAAGTACRL
jgi:hypothetical protein